ncbi:hypothetical protein LRB91_19520 [Leclercia adecarboxylata]|uniref:hypothetical protein n=1 Tax=Leclercia adecarboxylata TaxID=83655 RepID=UPI0022B783ED|nr:hypothetical protein [Leclercia adecarboxylata]MCZ7840988.1 hypothetical protein [Leclercia adecarboxylata]
MTLYIFILIFIYMTTAFFALGVITRIVTAVIYTGEVYLSLSGVFKVVKMSVVAGGVIAVGCLIFNKIDENNIRKKPPVDPDR